MPRPHEDFSHLKQAMTLDEAAGFARGRSIEEINVPYAVFANDTSLWVIPIEKELDTPMAPDARLVAQYRNGVEFCMPKEVAA